MLTDGNFQPYKNKPKLFAIEIATLAVLAETLGVVSINHLFSKLKTEQSTDFVS